LAFCDAGLAWLIVGSVVELIERLRLFGSSPRQSWSRARHLPRSVYGMVVAHAGLGVVVLGITASLTWHSAVLRDMRPGQSAKVGPYEFTLRGVREVPGPNYTARQGLFTVTEGGRYVTTMKPEVRQYSIPPMSVNRVALRPSLVADLYAAIGSPDGSGGYAVRLYHKPLISWIWLGALIMVVGGGLSLSDRRLRIGAPARKSKAYPVPGSIVTGA
jgi:cytochrome c-type biogenesis protein CcmF